MKTILIIEDNPNVLLNITEILQLSTYQVLQACNGKEGVELARTHKPDLIICDVMMPELDGYSVLHLLQSDLETACIPFIFLTAKAEKDDLQKAMGLGADGYLIKPFDDVALLETVAMRLKKTEYLKNELRPQVKNQVTILGSGRNHSGKLLSAESIRDKKIIHLRKKQFLYLEGDYPSAMYSIDKGKVKTFKTNVEGKEYITAIYKEGDFLGYTEIIENCNYTEAAMAMEETELSIISRQEFHTLLSSSPEIATTFIRTLAANILEREERLLQLAYNSVRKRVADILLFLMEKEGCATELQVAREDLSNLAGTSKETVIRTLSDFKQERLIDITKNGNILFLNPDKLRVLKN
ncbi:response regulator [Xanthocytophaga agilis]|uniref:Response regulator n=1 Tax=Xanthocytophaga agilis TaxID=3048010 RepID=A0AAE3R443_9BACT|nr:response regulator [Xanthocytophaga agilis]MDJ1500317.1 response regulator [Xanthocytophaga agilis]